MAKAKKTKELTQLERDIMNCVLQFGTVSRLDITDRDSVRRHCPSVDGLEVHPMVDEAIDGLIEQGLLRDTVNGIQIVPDNAK